MWPLRDAEVRMHVAPTPRTLDHYHNRNQIVCVYVCVVEGPQPQGGCEMGPGQFLNLSITDLLDQVIPLL